MGETARVVDGFQRFVLHGGEYQRGKGSAKRHGYAPGVGSLTSVAGGRYLFKLFMGHHTRSLLKKSEKHPNPSFRRKPESSILMILLILIFWTPAFAGVTQRFSRNS